MGDNTSIPCRSCGRAYPNCVLGKCYYFAISIALSCSLQETASDPADQSSRFVVFPRWASTKAKLAGNGRSSNLQQRLRCFQRAPASRAHTPAGKLETLSQHCTAAGTPFLVSRFSFAHDCSAIAGRACVPSALPLTTHCLLYRCMEAVR